MVNSEFTTFFSFFTFEAFLTFESLFTFFTFGEVSKESGGALLAIALSKDALVDSAAVLVAEVGTGLSVKAFELEIGKGGAEKGEDQDKDVDLVHLERQEYFLLSS